MAFCDFCTCEDCVQGHQGRFHAETVDGRWICDVCFTYDQCTADDGTGKPRNPNGPCAETECPHRPRLKAVEPQWTEGSGSETTRSLAEVLAAEKS